MSKSQNNRYISILEIKPKHKLTHYLSSNDSSKVIESFAEKTAEQHEIIQHESPDCIKSFEELIEYASEQLYSAYDLESAHTETPVVTIISDLPRSFISASLLDEEFIEDSIQQMKNEEQRMETEIKDMEYDEDYMKHHIKLMIHREQRMEHEIELMKRREQPAEEMSLVKTSLIDEEKYKKAELESVKQREKHMSWEIRRMKHYQTRIEDEIKSITREVRRMEYRQIDRETDFESIESRNETELTNYEKELQELQNELAKRGMRLAEHNNEIRKRETKLKENLTEHMECQSKLKQIRENIEREEECIQQEKQLRRGAIKQREYYERELETRRAERIKLESEPQEYSAERMLGKLQLVTFYEKHREVDILRSQLELDYEYKRHLVSQHISERKIDLLEMLHEIPIRHAYYDTSFVTEQPKYDIFISHAYQNDSVIRRIRNALPQWFSAHVKGHSSSANIKICLDNTSTAVIAIIDRTYELSKICQADIIHIFKRQFPLVLVIVDQDFKPNTNWLSIVWNASNTQKLFLNSPDFADNLRNGFTNAQWNLSPNGNISNTVQTTADKRSKRFLGDIHEWTVAYSNPAQVSHSYRQFISDPLRIASDKKLQDIYYKYIRVYFETSGAMSLLEKGANENDIHHFIQAYTHTSPFSKTLNSHLAANVLFYFESILHDTVDYQLVKCLIDFVALFIYRQELSEYQFTGTVYRGVVMAEEDLFRYIVGSRIMNTSFLSTSKDKQVAEVFSGMNQQEFAVLCTFIIENKTTRRTALDIGYISLLPCEREVLILPFSAFYVKSVKRPTGNSGLIEMMLVEDDSDILENIDRTIL